jgi:hypothetical protein
MRLGLLGASLLLASTIARAEEVGFASRAASLGDGRGSLALSFAYPDLAGSIGAGLSPTLRATYGLASWLQYGVRLSRGASQDGLCLKQATDDSVCGPAVELSGLFEADARVGGDAEGLWNFDMSVLLGPRHLGGWYPRMGAEAGAELTASRMLTSRTLVFATGSYRATWIGDEVHYLRDRGTQQARIPEPPQGREPMIRHATELALGIEWALASLRPSLALTAGLQLDPLAGGVLLQAGAVVSLGYLL